MSRSRLRIQVTFEPTRRGAEPMRAAYQMTLPEQTRLVREAEELSPPEALPREGEARRAR